MSLRIAQRKSFSTTGAFAARPACSKGVIWKRYAGCRCRRATAGAASGGIGPGTGDSEVQQGKAQPSSNHNPSEGGIQNLSVLEIAKRAWRQAEEDAAQRKSPEELQQQISQVSEKLRALFTKSSAADEQSSGLRDGSLISSQLGPAGSPSTSDLDSTPQEAQPATAAEILDAVPFYRRPWLAKVLALASLWMFACQWWPLGQVLSSAWSNKSWDVLAAWCLVVPDTPATMMWQMDVGDVLAGHWGSVWSSALLSSGLLSTLGNAWAMAEAGSELEWVAGPLVLMVQLAMCAAAAAASQAALQPLTGALNAPGVVAGLYVNTALWRRRDDPGMPLFDRPALAVLALNATLALYEPMVGIWSILGGALGGVLASFVAIPAVVAVREVLVFSVIMALNVLTFLLQIPRMLFRLVVAVGVFMWTLVAGLLQGLRQL